MDLSRLPSDVMKKLDPSLGFLWFSCQMEQEAGGARAGDLRESGAGAGPALGTLRGQVLGLRADGAALPARVS